MYSMKSMFWTNKKLSLMVAWSSSVSISCFKVSIGNLIWFFDSGNSIISEGNLWCPKPVHSLLKYFFDKRTEFLGSVFDNVSSRVLDYCLRGHHWFGLWSLRWKGKV